MPYQRLYRRYGSRRELLNTQEGNVLLVGIVLALLYLAVISVGYLISPRTSNSLIMITVTNLIFGRAAGMSLGYAVGFGHMLVVPLNMFIESVLVLIFYPLFVLSWRHLVLAKRLGSFMKRIKRSAERHEAIIQRFGILGLFAFVWLPFSMTGPMVGCVIGYMMGLGIRVNLGVVITSTCLAIVGWALFLREAMEKLAGYSTYAPITIVTTAIAITVIIHIRRTRKAQKLAHRRKPKAQK